VAVIVSVEAGGDAAGGVRAAGNHPLVSMFIPCLLRGC
jgi:hypothetical protein